MALPDGGVFPGVHPLPSDMLPANPTVARLRSGVRGGLRRGIGVEGAPSDPEVSADHKPSVSGVHLVGTDIHHNQLVCFSADDHTVQC